MRGLTAVACVALALGWAASAQAQVVVPYQVFSPVVETVTPVPVWQPGVVQSTVVQSPVVVPTTTFFAPQPTTTFFAPQTTTTFFAPQPTVTYFAPQPTMVFRPAPVVVSPAPVYVGRPVVVRPRVFVPGQPVRNVLRAAW